MNREEKKTVVEELTKLFQDSDFVFFVNPIGQTVEQTTNLRKSLFSNQGRMRVVKNTLTWLALDDAERGEYRDLVEGPTALALGGSPVELAKALVDFTEEKGNEEALEIRGGWLFGKRLDYEDVVELSKCPPLPVMRAKMLSTLLAPAQKLVGLLNATYGGLVRVVKAHADELEQ